MCAIVDASVANEVFGADRTEAGNEFRKWLDARGHLVTGGDNLRELNRASTDFKIWALAARDAGRMSIVDSRRVDRQRDELTQAGTCRSNDEHVIALAQIGGARLLFTNDHDLQLDFRDNKLMSNPRGRTYSTSVNSQYTRAHRDLLYRRRPLCASGHCLQRA